MVRQASSTDETGMLVVDSVVSSSVFCEVIISKVVAHKYSLFML